MYYDGQKQYIVLIQYTKNIQIIHKTYYNNKMSACNDSYMRVGKCKTKHDNLKT